ncbi:uncharacterized protein LOC107041680 [Diachasma alloeum]|uniref:uncharacterized protein LOC107041680 n=1 Tax=Diachasma alloeum TaxID=454923 RepID=UPI0007381C88|nr:uncharacterized protein LOC107041680 [Diachasma alloeum]
MNPLPATQHCCFVCENACGDPSEIAKLKNLLQRNFPANVQSCHFICSPCVASIRNTRFTQQCETPAKRMRPSSPFQQMSPASPDPSETGNSETPWETMIVNQVPMGIDCGRLMFLFSPYENMKDVFLCHTLGNWRHGEERIARITFKNETEGWEIWEDFQRNLTSRDNQALMITLVSDNYSPIQMLPDDCLEEIFLRLSPRDKFSVELVSKRWNEIGRKTWSNVTSVTSDDWYCHCLWRTVVSKAANSVKNVYVDVEENADKYVAPVADKCEHLKCLKCILARVDYGPCVPHMSVLIQKNQNLRRFELYFGEEVKNRDVDFIHLLSSQVERLDLRSLDAYLCLPTTTVLSKFSNLQVLILEMFDITENMLKGIGNVNSLKQLTLDTCIVHSSNFEDIAALTKLDYLSLRCTEIADTLFARILSNNKGLKYLSIKGAHGITDASFRYVQQLSQLQVLVMDGLSDITDAYFGGMPRIRGLSCERCDSITDEGMRKFFTAASPDIEEIRIGGCDSITEELLQMVLEWTERVGKSVRIYVDCLAYCCYNEVLRWMKTDKIHLISEDEYGPEIFGKDGWGVELVE